MKESGHILLDGDVIRYRSAAYGDWDLPVSDVRILGEATNQNGPFADDYFFCFASGPGMWPKHRSTPKVATSFFACWERSWAARCKQDCMTRRTSPVACFGRRRSRESRCFASTTFRRRAFGVSSLGRGKAIRRTLNESRRCWPAMADPTQRWTGATTVLPITAALR